MTTFVGHPPVLGIPPGTTPPATPPVVDPPEDPGQVGQEFSGSTISALQTFIDAVPDGSVIGLVAAATITGGASDQLHLEQRNGLTIVGRGATLRRTAAGTTQFVLIDNGCSNIAIYDTILDGSKSSSLGKWDVTYEHEHALALGGVVGFLADGCTFRDFGGDGLYVTGGADRWSQNVRVTGSTYYNIGRMGVAITDGGRDVLIDGNDFSQIGYYTWDIEPNGATVGGIAAGAVNVEFRDNTIGTKPYGDYPTDGSQALGYLIASTGASGGGPAKIIRVRNNVMTGGAMRVGIFNNGMTNQEWTISGNTGSGTFDGSDPDYCIDATAVATLTITGNTQDCTSDPIFETHPSCTNVTVSGNVL